MTLGCFVCNVTSELACYSIKSIVCEERVAGKLEEEEEYPGISVICHGVSDKELFYHAMCVVCKMAIDL